ncbi:MAG: hypothetical protein HY303_16270 [Candidatus Wallbacteria bacterium]|nr:hypothetical protein [Candidatus Wallbacteria bacterium]
MSAPFRACLLFLLGIPLLLVVLFWNRISLGGPNGQAPDWVQTLSFPIDVAVTRTLGPIDPPGEAQSARVLQLVASWSVAVAFYFGALAFALSRCRGNPLALDAILAWSVVLRVVAIASPPLLETDPRRYLWDGAVTAAGLDPYRHSPLEVLLYREGRIDAPSRTAEFELERLGTLSLDRRLDRATCTR